MRLLVGGRKDTKILSFPSVLLRLAGKLPLPLLHALGSVLGWLIYGISPTYRRNLRANLRQAGYTDARTRRAAIGAGGGAAGATPVGAAPAARPGAPAGRPVGATPAPRAGAGGAGAAGACVEMPDCIAQ